MKLIDVSYSFDRTVVTFYYWATGRVDFRKLVKELAVIFNCRIEMRQIGLRDEARIKDGYGICGQRICCARFLRDFEPITMKLVKTQNLPLDMSKISGLCGRLMCCLIYESKMYEDEKEKK
jgi:cell fate regulator YaaT (PSP1 superfamily)